MNDSRKPQSTGRRVFLSYAAADKPTALRIGDALRRAGLHVWFDAWELAVGDSIAHRIEEALVSSDLLVVLLSPRSVNSQWVEKELSSAQARELKDRAITVIPVLIEDCRIPPLLADRKYLDLRFDFDAGVQRLASQLGAAPRIRFSDLEPQAFERLVADLLVALGFSVQRFRSGDDRGFDFVASFRSRDPFGAERIDNWFVEVKLYRDQRVAVSTLQQLFGYLLTVPGSRKALVVTSGQLTSVAREFLSDIQKQTGRELRVIDGTELTGLLLQQPSLVSEYFSGESRP